MAILRRVSTLLEREGWRYDPGVRRSLSLLTVGLVLWMLAAARAQQSADLVDGSHPAIRYEGQSADPVAVFQRTPLASHLVSDGPSGYLASLLRALNVPVSSQILVFSKGSVQG